METLKPHEQVAVTVYTSCIPEHGIRLHVYINNFKVYAKQFGSMIYMYLHLTENVSFLVLELLEDWVWNWWCSV